MKYDERYLSNRDIDWFFKVNGKPVHVSSAGGSLPDRINDKEILRETQYQVSLLPNINTPEEITINQHLKKTLYDNYSCEINDYLESFISMAMKGFISIDRTNINDTADEKYHVVCIPNNLYSEGNIHFVEIDNQDFNISLETPELILADLFK